MNEEGDNEHKISSKVHNYSVSRYVNAKIYLLL